MIPILYDKTGKIKLGDLVDIIDSGYVEEERNGIFEFTIDYPVGYPLSDLIVEENMIETKPNEEQGLQKFRIYDTKRLMKNVISVFARHESFDLANDHVENVNLENASCEYALNTLFRNSHFSTHYRGYSDIINAQNYKIDNVNILNAIAGKEGSIIDTYGTGAEILRDGTNIHVLNKRGHDNEVTIEFGKNLTDFVLERDLTDLETRVGGFAKYTPEGGKETIVKSNWIDSPYIENFAHPYINIEGRRDYSDKFKNGEIPTVEKLDKLCEDEFKINKRDIPKSNYTIKFIALSKCVGYEGIQDKISLCDTVRIIDKRFNVDTKAKIIKYKYDFIKERYESMELGEPRTTLGYIIGGGGGKPGPPGKDGTPGKDGADGNIGDFPDSLPNTPILTATVKGWGSIDLSWTFEDKVYYTYELYASKTKDFKPNIFDLIHSGQSSSHLFQAKPGETWYFRVCAKNTHESRTEFSPQVTITTKKSDDFEEYFSTLGVGNLVANIFSADYMEAGIIKGNWIDMRHLTLTDGNGKRVFDCDDFGRLYADFSEFTINGSAVAQEDWVKTNISNSADGLKQEVSNEYATKTEVTQAVDKWKVAFGSTSNNGIDNSNWNKSLAGWYRNGYPEINCIESYTWIKHDKNTLWMRNLTDQPQGLFQPMRCIPGKVYTFIFKYQVDGGSSTDSGTVRFGIENLSVLNRSAIVDGWHTETITFTATQETHNVIIYLMHCGIYAEYCQRIDGNGEVIPPWAPSANEVLNNSTEITRDGILVKNGKIRIQNQDDYDVFWVDQNGQLCTDNIYIYGAEKDANLEIGGVGNKGIGIRSSTDGERYIDFCTVPKGASWEQQVRSGQLTRLYARGGDFWIMPTNKLVIQSAQWGFVKERLDEIIVHSNESWFAGNITAGGTVIAQDALRCRNIAHPEGGAGYTINVHAKLNLMDGTTFSTGVFASIPRSSMFFRTLAEKPLDILDSIEFIDKTKMPRFNSLIALPNEEEAIQEENTELLMDVSNIVGTPYASIDENGSAIASYEELLKLALKEIKELKNEVSILKEKVGA